MQNSVKLSPQHAQAQAATGPLAALKRYLIPENTSHRHAWVLNELASLPKGKSLLDAGCGFQPYRAYCQHLKYAAQDFGQYTGAGQDGALHNQAEWHYGKLDYTGDIWAIDAKNASFDAILCTEVFEHIPHPDKTLAEFARLLKKGGVVILTVPVNAIPHQTPYYFFSGLSREWYDKFAADNGLIIEHYQTYAGAAPYLAQELIRLTFSYTGLVRYVVGAAVLPFLLLRPLLKSSPEHPCFGVLIRLRKA